MTDPAAPARPVPRWLHAWAILTAAATLVLLILGQFVTSFRAGMADPIWPTEPWYLLSNYKLDAGYLIEHSHRIAGFAVGGLVAVLALGLWWTGTRSAVRWVGVCALLSLLSAFGQFHRELMAQRDAAQVVLPVKPVWTMTLSLLVVLAIGTARAGNYPRGTGLRLLGVAALLAVMVQGLLGGFRVKLNELVGTDLATVHGVFAQVVFCLLVAVAVLTGRPPAAELPADSRRTVGRLALTVVGVVFVQLLWGAMLRHTPDPLNQRLHLLTAFVVVAAAVWLLRAGFADPAARVRVAPAGWVLGGLLALQVALGVEAWMTKFGAYTLPELVPITPQSAAIRTLHTLVGTGVLASAVALTIAVWRPRSGSEGESEASESAAMTPAGSALTLTHSGQPGGTT